VTSLFVREEGLEVIVERRAARESVKTHGVMKPMAEEVRRERAHDLGCERRLATAKPLMARLEASEYWSGKR
jgi:hypothetical protein